jgi:ATP-dependent DNA helicase RecG
MNPNSPIEKEFRLKNDQKKALARAGLSIIKDLLYYFPSRYNNISEVKKIADLKVGDETNIYGKIISTKVTKAYHKKIPIAEVVVEDDTGKIKSIWFNQAYIAKMFKVGEFVKLTGKITDSKSGIYIANPEVEKTKDMPIDIGDSLFSKKTNSDFTYAIYPERRGITTKWIYHAIQKILANGVLDKLKDPIPKEILKKYSLPKLSTALVWVHSPKKEADGLSARKRFAFEEIFFIQINRQKAKKEYKKNLSYKIDIPEKNITEFKNKFPFTPTNAQNKAIKQVLVDFKKPEPMSRLLEGDVGSGKTFVAVTTAYAVVNTHPNKQDFGNLQVAYMAPTEILAKQHFESFIEYFKHSPINIGLITGSGCKKFPSKTNPDEATNISRTQLLKWVENGEIPILIGTHSLIQKTVKFQDLAFVIIDEQHRFGTKQRSKLVRKDNIAPHLLSMTATPIPRTLALTIYGDLDLTLLDEMPKGRKQIITKIAPPDKRDEVYEKIRIELKNGRQVFVICPRIYEPDPDKANALRVKSVKAEARRLKEKEFTEYEVDILHSKMKPAEKENIMADFANGDTDILVSTSVVEVGVNIPNATVIIIEGAERFGLAQLHQLRGRVLRSEHQAYCYLFSDTKTQTSIKRLRALEKAKNGFELSELDLSLRGSGQLGGQKQWGISDLGMEAIKNIKMVEAARKEAVEIIDKDFELSKYPLLKARLSEQKSDIHFE